MTLASPAGMLSIAALVVAVLTIGWLLRMLDTRIGSVAHTAEDAEEPIGNDSTATRSSHPPAPVRTGRRRHRR
jgi:hypothetical protein